MKEIEDKAPDDGEIGVGVFHASPYLVIIEGDVILYRSGDMHDAVVLVVRVVALEAGGVGDEDAKIQCLFLQLPDRRLDRALAIRFDALCVSMLRSLVSGALAQTRFMICSRVNTRPGAESNRASSRYS